MATLRDKREVLSVKGTVKNDTTHIRWGRGGDGRTDVCREFGFVNFAVKRFRKTVLLNRTDQE